MTLPKKDVQETDFRRIFLQDIPLIDTRSPGEFAKGSFPNAVNLPLMTNQERAQIGTTYKQKGQAAAIELGHQLVQGELKLQRVKRWCDFTEQHPQGMLFCWRGGLRSQLVQSWLLEAGIDYPRVAGGYKALRRYLIDQCDELSTKLPITLLAGRTGSGKTLLLNELPRSIDLEGLANHRGSSFGRRAVKQPNQIQFENVLSTQLIKLATKGSKAILLEDEGGFIGTCGLPQKLFSKMKISPMVLLEVPLKQRVETIYHDYILGLHKEYQQVHPEQAFKLFSDNLREALGRVKKRLGGELTLQIGKILESALNEQEQSGDSHLHKEWIELLLVRYYDPSYDYQLAKRQSSILFKGSTEEIKVWLET
jgi:tRNA 2-selenouridine synthase